MTVKGERTTLFLSPAAPAAGAPANQTGHSRAMLNRGPVNFGFQNPTGSLAREKVSRTGGFSATSWNTGPINITSGDIAAVGLIAAFASEPLAAQRVEAGQWAVAVQAEKLDVYTVGLSHSVYIWDPVAGAVRSYLWDSAECISGTMGINMAGFFYNIPCRAGVVEEGDMIVVEFWAHYFGGLYSGGPTEISFGGVSENFTGAGTLEAASFIRVPQRLLYQGDELPVFSFDVDWASALETVEEYPTSVITTRTGLEQRLLLRETPRVTLKFRSVGIGAKESAKLSALLVGERLKYRVPFWPSLALLETDVALGETVIDVGTTVGRRFVVGEEAILWKSPFDYEVVSVGAVDATTVTLSGGTLAGWAAPVGFMPLKQGWLRANTNQEEAGWDSSVADVEIELQEADPA